MLTPKIDLATIWEIVVRRTGLIATIDGNQDYANSYSYDYQNKPLRIYQQGQGTPDSDTNVVAYKRIQFRYNDVGQLTYINRFETPTTVVGTPSLRTVLEYDDANRLQLLSHKGALNEVSVTPLNEYVFAYDFASRIASINSTLDGLTEFLHSTSNQLTGANHDVGNLIPGSGATNPDEGYLFDANGNRIDLLDANGNPLGVGFVVDAQNRTLSDGVYSYQYDHEGNRTRRTLLADGSFEINTFDHRNRLTSVDFHEFGDVVGTDNPYQSVSYVYDAFNRMVHRSVDSNGDGTADIDQYFAGFDDDNSTLEFETAGGVVATAADLAHRRLYGPFIDQLIASENVDDLLTAGETLWPLTDHTGTIRDVAILNDGINGGGGTSGDFELISHRIYSSFGQLTHEFQPAIDPVSGSPLPTGPITSIDLDAGFTARFTDDLTGLTHHQHRWYDPGLGKWISEDPLSFAGGDINTTRYVDNQPNTYTDPTGLIAVSIDGGNGDAAQGSSNRQQGSKKANQEKPTSDQQTNFNVPKSAESFPWYIYKSPPPIKGVKEVGITKPVFSIDHKWQKKGGEELYRVRLTINSDIKILIDPTAVLREKRDIEKVYGHEQRHVQNTISILRDLRNELDDLEKRTFGSQDDGKREIQKLIDAAEARIDLDGKHESVDPKSPPKRKPLPPIGVMPKDPAGRYPQ